MHKQTFTVITGNICFMYLLKYITFAITNVSEHFPLNFGSFSSYFFIMSSWVEFPKAFKF